MTLPEIKEKSNRGGKRPGAGRKKGDGRPRPKRQAKTTRRAQIAMAALEDGEITPLEVMIKSMRAAWAEGNRAIACLMAEKAAPYVHPKLAAIEHSGNKEKPLSHVVEYLDGLDGLARAGLTAASATAEIAIGSSLETGSPLPH